MKKLTVFITALTLLFSFTACGASEGNQTSKAETSQTETPVSPEPDSTEENAAQKPSGSDAGNETIGMETAQFDPETGTVLLNSGYEMPIIGL